MSTCFLKMNINSTNKKYKRPKQKTQSTTNPETSRSGNTIIKENKAPETTCPLAAKDSEWVDILQTPTVTSSSASDDEEVLQLVECEDGPQMKPLAIMFPGLLEKDPNTLEGVLNKVMSTTEVTKHLVNLGQKANFTFMKKADRLIPRDKQWLESLTENSNSFTSMASALYYGGSVSSDYDADNEITFTLNNENEFQTKDNEVSRAGIDCNSINNNSDDKNICRSMKQIISETIQTNNETSSTEILPDKEDD